MVGHLRFDALSATLDWVIDRRVRLSLYPAGTRSMESGKEMSFILSAGAAPAMQAMTRIDYDCVHNLKTRSPLYVVVFFAYRSLIPEQYESEILTKDHSKQALIIL